MKIEHIKSTQTNPEDKSKQTKTRPNSNLHSHNYTNITTITKLNNKKQTKTTKTTKLTNEQKNNSSKTNLNRPYMTNRKTFTKKKQIFLIRE